MVIPIGLLGFQLIRYEYDTKRDYKPKHQAFPKVHCIRPPDDKNDSPARNVITPAPYHKYLIGIVIATDPSAL